MFRTDLLSIIRSLNTVFTATGIYHTNYFDCMLARLRWKQTVNITNKTNTSYCEYSACIKTPDDGQQVCPKHVEVYIKIKLRNGTTCWLLLYEPEKNFLSGKDLVIYK